MEQYTFINTTEFDFGEFGPSTLSVKNIFGYQSSTGTTGWMVDGFGGRIQGAVALNSIATYNYSSSANQAGNQPVYEKGPDTELYTNELQFRGDVSDGLISWILGGYYQREVLPSNTDGVRNMYQVFDGVLTPNLGWQPAFPFQNGGYTEQKAGYIQASVDLSDLFPVVAGVHLSGGFRRSWDKEKLKTIGVSVSYPSGAMVPGDPATSQSKSDGDNTSITLDVQVTDDLLVYLARRDGYRPGGSNQVIASVGLPNYAPTYGPETVKDWELGLKYAFSTDALQGRLNVAAYRADYTDIQRVFRAFVGGASAVYLANVAEARLEGIEVQGNFLMGRWQLDLVYSYGDAGYRDWVGSDPFNLIRPGNPLCLPESTDEVCLLDLTGNAIPNTPKHQVSATVSYDIPINDQYGNLMASVNFSHRSRSYLVGESERNLQIFGDEILDAISQPSYERVDLRLDWSNIFDSSFDAALYVNNATDEVYAVSAVTQMTTLGMGVQLYAPPRMWGAELSYRFGQ
jgi:iron complex outermembrane receptor protein